MNANITNSHNQNPEFSSSSTVRNQHLTTEQTANSNIDFLQHLLSKELQSEARVTSRIAQDVAKRIATEVERICHKSSRIQTSGQIQSWQVALARHRLEKCLKYYQLGSQRGRIELHSHLGAMVYRHVAPTRAQLGFQARQNLIEDFLQGFYMEAIKAFRRENDMATDYTPRTQLELAEYMAFTEQYAKRRINLTSGASQQLIILRAQGFARRQPPETTVDIEMAVESPKNEEAEAHHRSAALQQVRSQMMAAASDPGDASERERVISELIHYLESQGQSECVDYLILKLQDLSVPEIDTILGLNSRQRDYLQQRFKYHLDKFARIHHWQLVHQWLGADIDQKLGMSSKQWEVFLGQLSPQERQLLHLKSSRTSDQVISKELKCTPKQLQKRWTQLLSVAWTIRNGGSQVAKDF